jgi:hypothetical protein
MKYCSLCLKVFPEETVECLCSEYSWNKGKLKLLPIEPSCHTCGSAEDLSYREPWKGSYGTYGNECTCAVCIKKTQDSIAREEAMKYLILDNYRGEDIFCNDKEDVEESLKYYTDEPWEYESTMQEIIILKLELVTGGIKAEHFKPPYNTHIVFWDGESYRIEEVIQPELENQGSDYTLNW